MFRKILFFILLKKWRLSTINYFTSRSRKHLLGFTSVVISFMKFILRIRIYIYITIIIILNQIGSAFNWFFLIRHQPPRICENYRVSSVRFLSKSGLSSKE